MAIQITPGEPGSGFFEVNEKEYPTGKFFLYRSGDIVTVNSYEMGCMAVSAHYSEFEDENGEAFESVDELMAYLNDVIFDDGGCGMDGLEIVKELEALPEGERLSYEYLDDTPQVDFSGMDFSLTGSKIKLNLGYLETEGNVLIYDRKRMYGSHIKPLDGDIVEYYDAEISSNRGEGIVFHRDSIAPNFPNGFVKEAGDYIVDQLNIIKYQFFSNAFKLYSISNIVDYEAIDIHYGMLIHYDFNQDVLERTKVIDISGNQNDGVLEYKLDAEWIQEGTGYKIKLGNNEDADLRSYIRIPISETLQSISYDFSVLIEVGKGFTLGNTFFGSYSSGSGRNGFSLGTVSDGRLEINLNEESLGSEGRGRSALPDGEYPTDGSTKRYVITFDGKSVRFYIGGYINKTTKMPEGLSIQNNEDWYLGKINNSIVSAQTIINRFVVWNRVLTDKEIVQMENPGFSVTPSVLKYCPFETIITNADEDAIGTQDSWMKRQCYDDPGDIMVSEDFARNGSTSGRFHLQKGLLYEGSKHRTELLSSTGMEENIEDMKKWMSFSIYFPEDYYIDESHQIAEVIYQLHAGHGQSPPISVRTEYDHFYLQVCFGMFNEEIEEDAEFRDEIRRQFDFGKISPGHWHDFVFYFELDQGDQGVVKLWFNRELVVDYYGGTMYTNDLQYTLTWKVGLYCAQWGHEPDETVPEERVLYYDDIRIANNSLPDYIMFQIMDPEGGKAVSGIDYSGQSDISNIL
ncbi:heparin lyase I family protein [Echinicola sp. CAU 1574]|uniref:Heparin lyase I family protein n=1 Tax=Echinicola arenosa TaxID=2774144 RepID=A0ABR9AJ77_9BACT|nr:heparin lyase I family protein [Echinicola arenosa]MBD8487908.1 heparin lyase I family protein [Echinicola arenosa]